MSNQPKTGEPGAVHPRFLTLKPNIFFLSQNGRLKPIAGLSATVQDAVEVYANMVEASRTAVNRHNGTDGHSPTKTAVIVCGQVFEISFIFQVKDGEVIVPPFASVIPFILRKLRHVFN